MNLKLEWFQRKKNGAKRKYIFKWSIFHCQYDFTQSGKLWDIVGSRPTHTSLQHKIYPLNSIIYKFVYIYIYVHIFFCFLHMIYPEHPCSSLLTPFKIAAIHHQGTCCHATNTSFTGISNELTTCCYQADGIFQIQDPTTNSRSVFTLTKQMMVPGYPLRFRRENREAVVF